MLQLTNKFLRNTKSNLNLYNVLRYNLSTVPTTKLNNHTVETQNTNLNEKKFPSSKINKQNMIAAVFASLKDEKLLDINTPFTDIKISSATTIEELLSISRGSGVSRKHALKVVSILSNWTSIGKVKFSEFEDDPRFIRLCQVLTKNATTKYTRSYTNQNDDLAMVFNVTADDEAAKMVANITVPQMIKVMTSLSYRKRRSIMLLRALSSNILKSNECLDMKQCSDVLYSMNVLNFIDENLLERISNDACKSINDDIKKSSVIRSVITSMGLLKYKHSGLLNALSEWVLKYNIMCRPIDMFALFLTLATLNYKPPNFDKLCEVIIPQLSITDTTKATEWLDFVWALTILNKVNFVHISGVLSQSFINNLADYGNKSSNLKLINIDSVVEVFFPKYDGPRLDKSSPIRNIEIVRSKEKNEMNMTLVDCLKSLMSDVHINSMVNTGMGFCIDAECVLDKKCNPIPLDKSTGSSDEKRIAVMMYDYHDVCKGSVEPTGINILATRLLEAKGYTVLTVPYTDFKLSDKLIHRVQYLESKLKRLVQS